MKTYALCTLSTGLDPLRQIAGQVPLAGAIGLTRRPPTDAISGYTYVGDACEGLGLPFVPVERYALDDAEDRRRLLSLDMDLLLVLGWQRLLPDWLLQHCRVGAIGNHGSAYGIAGGRGRSPQNWALLLGERRFEISIFFLEPAVDSGRVIDTRSFDLTEHDDIRTSYRKAGRCVADMIVDNLKNGRIAAREGRAQHGPARYLPQRLPEDGEIDWRRTTRELHDFVRALTRPYPGAFSRFDGGTVSIWGAQPFSSERGSAEPGRVVERFESGELLVATGDGLLLVTDYTAEPADASTRVRAGVRLASCDFRAQMRAIVERHRRKHPDLPLAEPILRLAGMA